MSAKSALESIKNAFVESESQTIKTVNPHGYIVNNTFSKCEYYIGFEDMKGRTMTGQDEVTPLYTMQLTEKVACEVCNDTEDLKTICSDCITNECNDRISFLLT